MLKYSAKIWPFQSQREGDVMAIRYAVDLTDTERAALREIISKNKAKRSTIINAYILLALVQLNGDNFLFYNKSLGDLNVEKLTHKHPRSVDGVNDVWHAYPHSSRNIHDIAAMLILQLNWYRPAVGAQAPGS